MKEGAVDPLNFKAVGYLNSRQRMC